jgi:hypothetical protein
VKCDSERRMAINLPEHELVKFLSFQAIWKMEDEQIKLKITDRQALVFIKDNRVRA